MKNKVSMTEGNLWMQLILFTIPLLLGNLFQQLYNTVDVIVVGNFVGKNALAAVGSSNSIINMIVGFFMGVGTGASAVIAQFYGAGNKKNLKIAVHSTVFLTLVLGVIFTFVAILISPWLLEIIDTPQDVFNEGVTYLRIYFMGLLALLIYNMGSAILRAVGDSKRPLYFLIFSSIVNIVLDLVFVVYLGLGIAGVGYATVIAEVLSAILVIYVLINTKEDYKVIPKEIIPDFGMIKRVLSIGLPGGIQQSITAVSNLIVQGYINGFGAAAIAGFGAYLKIDSFLIMPAQSLSLAAVTFVGQNVGAGKIDRARESVKKACIIGILVNIIVCVPLFFFGDSVVGIFSPEKEVVEYGYLSIKYMVPLYTTLIVTIVYAGGMRGFGEGLPPMIVMLSGFVLLRQVFLFVGSMVSDSFDLVLLGYPITWVYTGTFMYLWYKKGKWNKKYAWAEEK